MDHSFTTYIAGRLLMRTALLALGFMLLAPLIACGAESELGRLFFTPAQRAALEHARQKNILSTASAGRSLPKPKAALPREIVVNGLLMRDDGMAVIWINSKSVTGETLDGVRVLPSPTRESVLLQEPESHRTLQVKVGQHADLLNGRVEESYQSRRAATRPGAATPEPQPGGTRPRTRHKPSEPPEDARRSASDERPGESAAVQSTARSQPAEATQAVGENPPNSQ